MTREQRLQKARTKLVLTQNAKLVFLACLLEVQDILDTTVETACTDGSCIRWNPEFIDTLDDAEVLFVLLHELLHIGLLHNVVSRHYDDHKRLNIAADLAVNSILKDIGVKLTANCLVPGAGQFKDFEHGKSLEHYYRILQSEADENLPEPQPGGIEPAGSEAAKNAEPGGNPVPDAAMSSEIIRAMVGECLRKAEECGDQTGSLVSAVKQGLEQKVDYRSVLKKYRTKLSRGGADWNRPNRRLRAAGANAARNKTRKIGDVIVLLDCSGSQDERTVNQCFAEIVGIFGESVGTIHVWQHDTQVVDKLELKQGQPLPVFERKTNDGTSHVEPFQQIEDSGLKVALVICLTDCVTKYPKQGPNVPTLWITNVPVSRKPPFGELLDNVI